MYENNMERDACVLAIAEQLLNDSDESEQDIDSDLEDEYREEEFHLSLMIKQSKQTLSQLLDNSRVSRYSEEVARAMDDTTFKTHFGMNRDTFHVVRGHLHGKVPEKYVDLDTQLMCALWMLGTQDSYRSTAERFNLSKGTVHFIVMRLCKELAAMADSFICWPSADQHASVAAKFQEKAGFPGVTGCVHDICIKIKEPPNADPDSSSSFHVQVQGVCNADMKFTFVRMWHRGCASDVYEDSELVQLTHKIGKQYHILGDLTYPLNTYLLTPYQSSDHLMEWQEKYNHIHKLTHVQIEHAFAQLKIRFWRLKSLDMSLKDKVADVILTCCVLHNIILDHEGPLEMTYSEMRDMIGQDSHGPVPYHQQHGNPSATSKREKIARKLC